MIFVTVGGQGPFDRMVKEIDAWAAQPGTPPVFAQVGEGAATFPHLECVAMLGPAEFRQRVEAADLIVAHAGMGTILLARELSKPLVIMSRLARHGEQRNDHQVATAERFAGVEGIWVAEDGAALRGYLDRWEALRGKAHERPADGGTLVRTLRQYLSTPR